MSFINYLIFQFLFHCYFIHFKLYLNLNHSDCNYLQVNELFQ
jgi:hypothetical protein